MIYAFDEADAELTLMPIAVRRGLDVAGIKLSLSGWQTLALADRRELVRLGAEAVVDAAAVRRVARRASGQPLSKVQAYGEPADMPEELAAALGLERPLERARWAALRPLDRYVFDKLLRRDRMERLRVAYDEIVGGGVPRDA